MRMMVFFDLPVVTKAERRAYTVFRQHIRHVRLQPDWATQQP